MANKKISELDNLAAGSQEDTDLLEVARESSATNYKLTWANVKAILKTYFDTLYAEFGTTTPTCKTLIPRPMTRMGGGVQSNLCNSNTTLQLGMAHVPYDITVNKISFRVGSVTTPGTLKLVVYSEDGQTKKIEHETAYITETGLHTETLSSGVELVAGVYYMGILSIDTCYLNVSYWTTFMSNYGASVDGGPVLEGHLTVTADTIPSTITPNAIEYVETNTPYFRLDN